MANQTTTFISGLDLGQLSDYTALCVAQCDKHKVVENSPTERRYGIRHLYRWPLRTSYTDIVTNVVETFSRPALAGSVLCVDRTGVGVAVFDMLRKARPDCRLVPVTITGGAASTVHKDGCWHVPKRELAGVLGVLLGKRRLQIAPGLPLAKVVS